MCWCWLSNRNMTLWFSIRSIATLGESLSAHFLIVISQLSGDLVGGKFTSDVGAVEGSRKAISRRQTLYPYASISRLQSDFSQPLLVELA